jgi:hypothetical protein
VAVVAVLTTVELAVVSMVVRAVALEISVAAQRVEQAILLQLLLHKATTVAVLLLTQVQTAVVAAAALLRQARSVVRPGVLAAQVRLQALLAHL